MVEILVAYIHNTKPEFEVFISAKSFVPCCEGIINRTTICLKHLTGIILLEMKESYPHDLDKILSPSLFSYIKDMNEGKVKRLTLAKASMISKYTVGLDTIQTEYLQKDLELLDEGYESFEQLSDETSSQ